jgi:hypothetical protein
MAKPKTEGENVTRRLKQAKADITEAEADLDKVISAIAVLGRPEKVAVSEVVREAFDKLKSAKIKLEELEQILADR